MISYRIAAYSLLACLVNRFRRPGSSSSWRFTVSAPVAVPHQASQPTWLKLFVAVAAFRAPRRVLPGWGVSESPRDPRDLGYKQQYPGVRFGGVLTLDAPRLR